MDSTQEKDVEINSSNFGKYFFDVRRHRAQPGQVLAKFTAVAVLQDGPEKRDLIKVLKKDKATAAASVMKKIYCAREPDNYRICREICEDLLSGMSEEEVSKKDHEYTLEALYYTKKEHVPKNDPHWETIQSLTYDPESKTFKVDIEI